MAQQLAGAKLVTRLIGREHRAKFLEIEAQLRHHVQVIDRWYALLGPRNWIFHDDLGMSVAESMIELSPDDAERRLIGVYRDQDGLARMIRRLRQFDELRVRLPLVEAAERDWLEGRFSAATQFLLAVMDGFVNDLDRAKRAGLHARDPESMVAWDSVVGHHLGLSNALRAYHRPFSKIVTDEVFELHRHGIVHGMVVNYDNDVVTAKGWNHLFAVTDWAVSRDKHAKAKPKDPLTLGGLVRSFPQFAESQEHMRLVRASLDAWQPSTLARINVGFEADEAITASRAYLEAWQRGNYGAMAQLLSPLVAEDTPGRTAGVVREAFEHEHLDEFELQQVKHLAASVAEVDAVLEVRGSGRVSVRLRWIRAGEDGMAVAPIDDGRWGLVLWTKEAMVQRRSSAD